MEVNVLMTLDQFIETNRDAIKELLPSIDKTAPIVTIASETPTRLSYRDPKRRFSLDFPSVGSPANTTRMTFSRVTRLGREVMAMDSMSFAQSDAASLAQRVNEALELRRKLLAAGFKHTNYDAFEARAGSETLTTLDQLAQHASRIEVERIGGLHLFVVEHDELIVDIALIHQNYPHGGGSGVYALYVTIDEKIEGVE